MVHKMNSPFEQQQKYPIIKMLKRKRKQEKPRQSEADIRNVHIEQGAILLQFTPHQDASNSVITTWKQMEKYGFLVTTDGCMIPHKQYWGSTKSRAPARALVPQFFF